MPVGEELRGEMGHPRAEIRPPLRDEAHARRRQRRHGARRVRRAEGQHGRQAGQRGGRLQSVEEKAAVEEGGGSDTERGVEPRLHHLRPRRARHDGQRRRSGHPLPAQGAPLPPQGGPLAPQAVWTKNQTLRPMNAAMETVDSAT